MTSCIFTVIKDEHEYLDEWIQYHLNLGINHIFIFEDIESESHKDICIKYCDKVSLYSVDLLLKKINKQHFKNWFEQRQAIYNKEGIWWIKENYNYDWCFYIDCDEYITLENDNETLNKVLNKYCDYDVVILNWQNYNANGYIKKPDYNQKCIIETYTQICNKSIHDSIWKSTKLMYKLTNLKKYYIRSTHLCSQLCKWCKTDYSQELHQFIYKNIYLRHYITKSWEEYVWKLKNRGMFFPKHRNYNEFFEMNQDMKYIKEELINKYINN